MSRLSEKYKIPEPVIKNMIQDGVIYSAFVLAEEIHKLKSEGKTVAEISDITKCTDSYIYRILKRTK